MNVCQERSKHGRVCTNKLINDVSEREEEQEGLHLQPAN